MPARRSRLAALREEPLLLAGALIAVSAAIGFLKLASEVLGGDPLALDSKLLLLFRRAGDPAHTTLAPWVTEAMRDCSALGGPVVTTLIVGAVAGYLAIRRRWIQTSTVLAASIGGATLTGLIKLAYERPRPDVSLHLMPATSPGFPSGHSMLSAVIYLTLGALVARVTPGTKGRMYVIALAMLVTILVGISRVYLGVHYPSDVLAGWAVGLVWALLCWMVARAKLAKAAARALHVPENPGDD